jgi:hypothetical protein
VVSAKKGNSGAIVGGVIAVLGIAAAFAIIQRKPATTPPPVAEVRPAPAVANPTPASTSTAAATRAATTETAAANAAPEAPANAEPEGKPADATKRVATGPVGASPAAAGAAAPAPSGATTTAPAAKDDAQAKAAASANGKQGDLQAEMAKAVGPIKKDDSGQVQPTPEPVAGTRNQSVPEQPSQGSVQAAISAVLGGAKGCVSDADDVTRATVTFSSAGNVSSVSVNGWAAAHGKSACVQAALKSAKVGPFSKPTFAVPVTIRP